MEGASYRVVGYCILDFWNWLSVGFADGQIRLQPRLTALQLQGNVPPCNF